MRGDSCVVLPPDGDLRRRVLLLEAEEERLEGAVDVDESEEVFEKLLDKVGVLAAAEGLAGLGKVEEVVERLVDGLEAAEAVAQPGGGAGGGGRPRLQVGDLVAELGNDRVRPARETGGSDVDGFSGFR